MGVLHVAASNGKCAEMELLLKKGLNISQKDSVSTKLGVIVAKLLANSPNYSSCQGGRQPLHYATLNGHTAAVELLLENGADIEALDEVRSINSR